MVNLQPESCFQEQCKEKIEYISYYMNKMGHLLTKHGLFAY